MTKIGENIKKLRQVKNLTQQSFADLFEVTRGNISSYEEKRAEPKIETILKIANYFSIPVQHLIQKNLTVNEILHFDNYFEESESVRNVKNLSSIPFLSRETIQAKKNLLINIENYPTIFFPTYNPNQFIALEYNSNISTPIDFEYNENAILFFEHLEIEKLHLIANKFGLYITDDDIYIGKYIMEENKLMLQLNEWKKAFFEVDEIKSFYLLHSIYHQV